MDTSFHLYVTHNIKAWTLHESWHKAWASIREHAAAAWSPPVEDYECVNQQYKCCASFLFLFWLQTWNVPFKIRKDGNLKNLNGMVRTFQAHFSFTHFHVTALLRRREKGSCFVIMCIYSFQTDLWETQKKSAAFSLYWWFMFSFYPKAEKRLKKHECNRQMKNMKWFWGNFESAYQCISM